MSDKLRTCARCEEVHSHKLSNGVILYCNATEEQYIIPHKLEVSGKEATIVFTHVPLFCGKTNVIRSTKPVNKRKQETRVFGI